MSNLHLKYDGPAVAGGTMDVYTLAPALISFGDMAKEVNRIVNGPKQDIKINIQSDFKHGSFLIDFNLVMSLIDHAKSLFNAQHSLLKGAEGVAAIIVLYLKVRKHLKGEKPKSISPIDMSTNITIVNINREKIEAPREIEEVIKNKKINDALEGIIFKPLQKAGIELADLIDLNTERRESVTREESSYFKSPKSEVEEELPSSTQTIGVTIHTVSFETNIWRFVMASKVKWLEISDEDFLQRVRSKEESFRRGDILKVDILTEQALIDNELQTKETITKVIKHIGGPEQENIDFSPPGEQ